MSQNQTLPPSSALRPARRQLRCLFLCAAAASFALSACIVDSAEENFGSTASVGQEMYRQRGAALEATEPALPGLTLESFARLLSDSYDILLLRSGEIGEREVELAEIWEAVARRARLSPEQLNQKVDRALYHLREVLSVVPRDLAVMPVAQLFFSELFGSVAIDSTDESFSDFAASYNERSLTGFDFRFSVDEYESLKGAAPSKGKARIQRVRLLNSLRDKFNLRINLFANALNRLFNDVAVLHAWNSGADRSAPPDIPAVRMLLVGHKQYRVYAEALQSMSDRVRELLERGGTEFVKRGDVAFTTWTAPASQQVTMLLFAPDDSGHIVPYPAQWSSRISDGQLAAIEPAYGEFDTGPSSRVYLMKYAPTTSTWELETRAGIFMKASALEVHFASMSAGNAKLKSIDRSIHFFRSKEAAKLRVDKMLQVICELVAKYPAYGMCTESHAEVFLPTDSSSQVQVYGTMLLELATKAWTSTEGSARRPYPTIVRMFGEMLACLDSEPSVDEPAVDEPISEPVKPKKKRNKHKKKPTKSVAESAAAGASEVAGSTAAAVDEPTDELPTTAEEPAPAAALDEVVEPVEAMADAEAVEADEIEPRHVTEAAAGAASACADEKSDVQRLIDAAIAELPEGKRIEQRRVYGALNKLMHLWEKSGRAIPAAREVRQGSHLAGRTDEKGVAPYRMAFKHGITEMPRAHACETIVDQARFLQEVEEAAAARKAEAEAAKAGATAKSGRKGKEKAAPHRE